MAENEFPDDNELVLATIKKVLPYGAFCALSEYGNREAFLHVSEVAPRWIKNIREFISEGQRVVVKILRVDREKSQIDVSLRRVSEEERKNKQESVKRAARVDKLLQIALTKAKSPITVLELVDVLAVKFGDAYGALEAVLETDDALADLKIDEALKAEIIDIVRKSIKKARVSAKAELTIKCFGSNGIESIKKAISIPDPDTAIRYVGAPHYYITVFAADYKTADKKLQKAIAAIEASMPKDCTFESKVEE